MRTAATTIENINLIKIVTYEEKVKKFNEVSELVQQETEFFRKDMQVFEIVANTKKYF